VPPQRPIYENRHDEGDEGSLSFSRRRSAKRSCSRNPSGCANARLFEIPRLTGKYPSAPYPNVPSRCFTFENRPRSGQYPKCHRPARRSRGSRKVISLQVGSVALRRPDPRSAGHTIARLNGARIPTHTGDSPKSRFQRFAQINRNWILTLNSVKTQKQIQRGLEVRFTISKIRENAICRNSACRPLNQCDPHKRACSQPRYPRRILATRRRRGISCAARYPAVRWRLKPSCYARRILTRAIHGRL
jgi:hypothetical protein